MAADLGAEISWNLLSATALHEHWQLGTPHPCSPPSWIRLCPSAPPPRALGFFVISPALCRIGAKAIATSAIKASSGTILLPSRYVNKLPRQLGNPPPPYGSRDVMPMLWGHSFLWVSLFLQPLLHNKSPATFKQRGPAEIF